MILGQNVDTGSGFCGSCQHIGIEDIGTGDIGIEDIGTEDIGTEDIGTRGHRGRQPAPPPEPCNFTTRYFFKLQL